MGQNLVEKLVTAHLVGGAVADAEWRLRVDQVLMQDATGTMACMEFDSLGEERIRVPLAVLYVDHNMLQIDHRNAEDHLFLQSFCARRGIHFSRPGNGICHQVHVERFARPGALLVGSDSHTPTSGALGSLAIGTGGVDVATAMAGEPFELERQLVVGVRLEGRLPPWVSGKDVILELLRRLDVRGGIGRIFEFHGAGVASLRVADRVTICNMITELGATTGLFPADERTRDFLALQERAAEFHPIAADAGATYDEDLTVILDDVEPLVAQPPSPGNVVPVRELAGLPVAQVCFGSSVNSSYEDLALPASVLAGTHVPDRLHSVTLNPGSRQVLETIVRSGVHRMLVEAGVRILEPSCGPCVGMGQAPPENEPSVRTFNRNFRGRSGTWNDAVYLVSPATAAATALRGVLTDPRTLGDQPRIEPVRPIVDDSLILAPPPPEEAARRRVFVGRNIKPPPPQVPLDEDLEATVLIVLGDDVPTGSMSPDGAETMADRSNVAAIAEKTFIKEDRLFVERARRAGPGLIVAGLNYGQGSSREHAVLAPKYLGVRAVLARSFARIHRRNLIYQGVVPLILDEETRAAAKVGERWAIPGLASALRRGSESVGLATPGAARSAQLELTAREREILVAGGILAWLSGHPTQPHLTAPTSPHWNDATPRP